MDDDVHPQLQQYIVESGVQQLFVGLLDELLLHKPRNPILYVSDYLQEHFPHQLHRDYIGNGTVPFDDASSADSDGSEGSRRRAATAPRAAPLPLPEGSPPGTAELGAAAEYLDDYSSTSSSGSSSSSSSDEDDDDDGPRPGSAEKIAKLLGQDAPAPPRRRSSLSRLKDFMKRRGSGSIHADMDSDPKKKKTKKKKRKKEKRPRRKKPTRRPKPQAGQAQAQPQPQATEQKRDDPQLWPFAGGPRDAGDPFWARAPFKARPSGDTRRRHALSAEAVTQLQVVDRIQRIDRAAAAGLRSEEEAAELQQLLARAPLLKQLDRRQRAALVTGAEARPLEDRQALVAQGEDPGGAVLVAEGHLHLVRDGEVVATYRAGQVIFEAAALYPLAAPGRLLASGPARLWLVARADVRSVGFDVCTKRRAARAALLAGVPLLANLTDLEVQHLADALQSAEHADGAVVVRQGDPSDHLFIVEEGEAVVSQIDATQALVEVDRLAPGRFFGEMALLETAPSHATVTARGPLTVLALHRHAFGRTLGAAADVLNREQGGLATFMAVHP